MKTKQAKRRQLFKELNALHKAMGEMWVDNALPLAWDEIEDRVPVTPVKDKVTLYLDRDVLRWFRAMGRGFHARIAAVLRIYHLSMVTGDVRQYPLDRDGYEGADYLAEMEDNFTEKLCELVEAGAITKADLEAFRAKGQAEEDMVAARSEILAMLGAVPKA